MIQLRFNFINNSVRMQIMQTKEKFNPGKQERKLEARTDLTTSSPLKSSSLWCVPFLHSPLQVFFFNCTTKNISFYYFVSSSLRLPIA